ncbi:MAG: SagB/ThcOx family dehydrogenase [Candidatus Zixiibacteriota bacterium]
MSVSIIRALSVCLAVAAGSLQPEENVRTIGPRFHFETSYDAKGLKGKEISTGTEVPLYKTYPGARKIALPPPAVGTLSFEEAVAKRRSVRQFETKAITLEQIARLLHSANGITQNRGGTSHRGVPSAGALYPIELYLVANSVTGLDSGIYHFQVRNTSLEEIKKGDFSERLRQAALGQEALDNAPAAVVITARFDRTTHKYADRGYRYVYMEAGEVCQTLYLQATTLGLGTVAIGAFLDDEVNRVLDLNGSSEAGLLIMPIGYPRE